MSDQPVKHQIALLLNRLILAAIAKGRNAEVEPELRITDADLERIEQQILDLVPAYLSASVEAPPTTGNSLGLPVVYSDRSEHQPPELPVPATSSAPVTKEWCNAEGWSGQYPYGLFKDKEDREGYACTLEKGHGGPHVGQNVYDEVVACWFDDAKAEGR